MDGRVGCTGGFAIHDDWRGDGRHPGQWHDTNAARCHYEELLEAGIRIREYEPTMVHAKTLVADRSWCAVGTINFDNRSVSLNEEVGLLAQDGELGCRLHRRFEEDLEHAKESELDAFRARGLTDRARERFRVLFSCFL